MSPVASQSRVAAPLLFAWLAAAAVYGQIPYTGSGYAQNFDSLDGPTNNITNLAWRDNATLPGWYADHTTYGVTNGTLGGSAAAFDNPSAAINRGLFSFGTSGSSDRALGARAAGTTAVHFGVRFVNHTGRPITRFSVAYTGEQWFKSTADVPQSLDVDYQVGAAGLARGTWTGIPALAFGREASAPGVPTALNGNVAANRAARIASVTDVNWEPGEELWIRFTKAGGTGPEHGLAVDDFALWTGDGGALFFNGISSYVTMGVARPLGLGVFTIECWFLRTGAGATTSSGSGGVTAVPLVAKGRAELDGSNVDCDYFLGLDAAGRLVADFEAAPARGITAGQNFPIVGRKVTPPGIWTHAAVTYDGTSWRLYVNGELDATLTPPAGASPRADSIQHFGIGTAMTSTGLAAGFYQGAIDEVRIWNVARTAAEIGHTRDLPLDAATPGLVARYALDEGDGASTSGLVAGAPAGTLRAEPVWTVGRRLAPNVPPEIVLTSPTGAFTGMFPVTVPMTAVAEDPDGAILKIEFLVDDIKAAEVTEPPYAFDWKAGAPGPHRLIAAAIDNAGARSISAPVTITIDPNPNRPPSLALVTPAAATGVGGTALLSVDVADPEHAPLRVVFHGRKTVPPTPGADFVIGTLPDTQNYTEDFSGRSASCYAQTRWYVENRDRLNLAFVSHLGDISEHGDVNATTQASNLAEWLVADAAMKTLENPTLTLRPHGIPWGGAPGNHDQSPMGNPAGTTTFFNQFFGVSRFAGRGYYGGHFGANNNNNYELFSASGLDFIILHLEYDARGGSFYQPVLDWADALLKAHPHRRAIVTSHWIMGTGNPGGFGTQGRAIYERLKTNPNLFLLLGGHIHGEGRRTDTFDGRVVYSILQDYQDRANGGDGWLRFYVFSPARNTINARTYSPVLDRSESDEDSEFTLPYEMQAPVGDWGPLGSVAVAPGGTIAGLEWTGLEPGSHYEWYATVQDEINTVAASPSRFATAVAGSPIVALTAPAVSARFNVPAAIRLAATAQAASGTVSRVEFYEGATKLGVATTPPYEFTWSGAISGSYVLSAVAIDNRGVAAVSSFVPVTVANPNNRPPTAKLTNPAPDTRVMSAASVTVGAAAPDADGVIANVEFFAGAVKIGERTTPPFDVTWSAAPAGNHALTVRVTDNDGGVTTSAPVAITVIEPVVTALIPRHAQWRYLDDGSDAGTAWRAASFDDSRWAAGPAELGYGEGDEATVVGFGPNPASRAVTTYFRHRFTVGDPAAAGQLTLNLLRDDGAIVYLNGTEIGRSGLSAGTTYRATTLAPAATEGADERRYFPLGFTTDPARLLVRGENTLAVEVHQQSTMDADLSFDLELLGRRFPIKMPPAVALTAPGSGADFVTPATIPLAAAAADADGTIAKVEFFGDGVKVGEAIEPPYAASWTNAPAGRHVLTAVATDNDGNFINSAPVSVAVREANPGRLVNLSIRSSLTGASGPLILAFVTGGDGTAGGTKPLLLRAIGPALAGFGVTGVVADPVMSLYRGNTPVAANDNWAGDERVRAVTMQVGAFPLADLASRDAALVLTGPAGAYSLEVSGGSGVMLAEIYDATPADAYTPATPRLINASVRALVGPGNQVLLAGLVVGGTTERTVLIRAVGPGLSGFGVTNALVDPTLEIFHAGREIPIAGNQDWGGTATLVTVFAKTGAFTLPPTSRDAALVIRLAPGVYTARLSGPTGASGVALLDLYEIP